MPAIVVPPDLERRPRRTEENDGGHGRRPPNGRDLKRTGGGGDNDNGESASHGRRPGERLTTYRLGLFFILGAIVMFFVGIVSVFFASQSAGHYDAYNHYINGWLPTTIPPILWLNTAILLLSSITVEVARRHMFHDIDALEEWFGLGKPTSLRALPWLVVTLVLGSVFLAGQMTAWHQLQTLGASFQSSGTSGHSFYIITCAHAFHLMLGVLGLVAALVGLHSFRKVENRQIMVDCVAWYWHSMGALWLCLFLLLAFCQ